jgi:hypothetical protein
MAEAPAVGPVVAPPPPKVAVIAVHGVGYHAPGASANAMADLLLSLPSPLTSPMDAPRSYSAFEADTIQVPVQPAVNVRTDPMLEQRLEQRTQIRRPFAFLQERSANFAAYLTDRVRATRATAAPGSVGNEFMHLLLRDYLGGAAGDAYDTTCLKAKRAATAPGGEREVHVYEAYWNDLARPKNTLLSFFFALFQLLLHVGSLSRLAIDTGAAENPGRVWRAFRAVQEYAVRILQIPIPLLNLILLIAAFSVLPQQIPGRLVGIVALFFAGLLGVVLGFLAWRKPVRRIPGGPLGWAMLPLVFAGVGVLIGYGLYKVKVPSLTLAAIVWWGLGAALFLYVLKKYDKIHNGAWEIGLALYSLSFAAFVVALVMCRRGSAPLQQATLWTMQWLLAALRVSWTALSLLAFAALILGYIAWRILPTASPEQARARAAVRTSRLALALPALLILLIVIFLWGGLFDWATHTSLFPHPLFEAKVPPTLAPGGSFLKRLYFDPADISKVLPEESAAQHQARSGPSYSCAAGPCIPDPPPSRHEISANNYFAGYLVWLTGPGLAIILALMIAGFFLLTWWALPSVFTETVPLRSENVPPRWSTNGESLHMGAWISRGLDSMAIVTILMWCAIFLVPAIFFVWARMQPNSSMLATMNGWTDSIILRTGKLTASLALLGLIARYTSSALGIVLDVDNYLRTYPMEATPRAKIAERYVSLLRHIAAYRDEQGRGYNSVVIVAHSLGALITADLLRFLRKGGDPALGRIGYGAPGGNQPEIPVTLFTMGNPLRQFLNRFFPHLYDWVNLVPSGSLSPFGTAKLTPPPPIPADALPDPSDLGVQHWVNAYRSGDYVGRSLWVDEWYGRNLDGAEGGTPADPIYIVREAETPLPQPSPREEMCIVAGGHQHYWDNTATDIAQQLNALI